MHRALLLALLLSACGADDDHAPAPEPQPEREALQGTARKVTPTPSPSPAPIVLPPPLEPVPTPSWTPFEKPKRVKYRWREGVSLDRYGVGLPEKESESATPWKGIEGENTVREIPTHKPLCDPYIEGDYYVCDLRTKALNCTYEFLERRFHFVPPKEVVVAITDNLLSFSLPQVPGPYFRCSALGGPFGPDLSLP